MRRNTASSLATGEVFSLHLLVFVNMALEGRHESPGITVAMPRRNDLSLVTEKHKGRQTAAGYVLFESSRLHAAGGAPRRVHRTIVTNQGGIGKGSARRSVRVLRR